MRPGHQLARCRMQALGAASPCRQRRLPPLRLMPPVARTTAIGDRRHLPPSPCGPSLAPSDATTAALATTTALAVDAALAAVAALVRRRCPRLPPLSPIRGRFAADSRPIRGRFAADLRPIRGQFAADSRQFAAIRGNSRASYRTVRANSRPIRTDAPMLTRRYAM